MSKRSVGKRSSKKAGRNKSWCQAYRAGCRREINKKRKIARHCRRFPHDLEAQKALDRVRAGG